MPTGHFRSKIEYYDGKAQSFTEALQVSWGDKQDAYATLTIHHPENRSHNVTRPLGEVHLTEFDLDELIDTLQRIRRYNRQGDVGDVIKAPHRKLSNLPVGSLVMRLSDGLLDMGTKGRRYRKHSSGWEVPDAAKTSESNDEFYEDLPSGSYVVLEIGKLDGGMQINVTGGPTGPQLKATVEKVIAEVDKQKRR